jgi:glutamine synthetase
MQANIGQKRQQLLKEHFDLDPCQVFAYTAVWAFETESRVLIGCEAVGWPLVNAFCAMKKAEIERFRTYVTEWELNEYAWHLIY